MKLIIGLGNPGKEYENTRHNVGFLTLDKFAAKKNIDFNFKKFNGIYTNFIYNNEKVILLKPLKYMNLSGEVVRSFIDYFKIEIEDILVISDDIDIEIGKYKIKQKGSCGGHNGLRNIEQHIGTKDYKRIKIGIKNDDNIDAKNFVLGKFSKEEKKSIDLISNLILDILDDYLEMSFDKIMNNYNGA